jgi:probable rRNA maturation factor
MHPNFELDSQIQDDRWRLIVDLYPKCETLCLRVLNHIMYPLSDTHTEVFIRFTNNDNIQKINREHRQKDKPTNVLSFPGHDFAVDHYDVSNIPHVMLGDIILSYEMVEKEAIAANISFEHHLYHMISHGMLHLLGYDHEIDDEAEYMETQEVAILQTFNIKNPYL